MKILRILLQIADTLFHVLLMFLLFVAGCYSLFVLWDNQRIYSAAESVQADMLMLKPQSNPATEDITVDFSQLQQINSDICGWLSLSNTQIQYPIIQGETNLSYINRDIYGNFALAGSIYLDSRNDNTFRDTYSLLYGHHMDSHRMFGDLDLYTDSAFFKANHSGTLLTPQQNYKLEILSCLVVNASDKIIFDPSQWKEQNKQKLLTYIVENALHLNIPLLSALTSTDSPMQLIALSTCSAAFTDARTIVIAVMYPD